jgi:hypothetical protein
MTTNYLQRLTEIRIDIATLEKAESHLVEQIIKATGHDKIGEATYDFEGKKIIVATKENVTLDKAVLKTTYEEWMPINRSYTYVLRAKDYAAMMSHGTPAQRKFLASVVTTKAAKPSVKIKEET